MLGVEGQVQLDLSDGSLHGLKLIRMEHRSELLGFCEVFCWT
jgi:hypothetical protein